MHPELIHDPYVATQSVLMVLGFVAAVALAVWRAQQEKIPIRHILLLALVLGIVVPVGGRILGHLVAADSPDFWGIFKIWKSGPTVIYGGLLFAVVAVMEYSIFARVSAAKLGDVFAPALALGLVFAKLGCFLAGCCWGDVCVDPAQLSKLSPELQRQVQTIPAISQADFPFAVTFPRESVAFDQQRASIGLISRKAEHALPVHPVQLYEAALALALCVALLWFSRRKKTDGEVFWMFGMGYGTTRFFTEFLRAMDPPILWGLTASQFFGIAFAAVSFVVFVLRRRLLAGRPPLQLETCKSAESREDKAAGVACER